MDLGVSEPQERSWQRAPNPPGGVAITASYTTIMSANEREILTRDNATFVLGREREVK